MFSIQHPKMRQQVQHFGIRESWWLHPYWHQPFRQSWRFHLHPLLYEVASAYSWALFSSRYHLYFDQFDWRLLLFHWIVLLIDPRNVTLVAVDLRVAAPVVVVELKNWWRRLYWLTVISCEPVGQLLIGQPLPDRPHLVLDVVIDSSLNEAYQEEIGFVSLQWRTCLKFIFLVSLLQNCRALSQSSYLVHFHLYSQLLRHLYLDLLLVSYEFSLFM